MRFQGDQQYLKDVEPEAAAAIACKVAFDKVFATKKGSSLVPNVTDAIGQAVENECMMRHYEAKVPGLLRTLKENYFHKASGTHQKVKVITTLMNRYDVPHWHCWGRGNRVKLGGWLLDCICEVKRLVPDRHASTRKQTYELRDSFACVHGDQGSGHGSGGACSVRWPGRC